MKHCITILSFFSFLISLPALGHGSAQTPIVDDFRAPVSQWARKGLTVEPEREVLISILSTNDIHGGVEASRDKTGRVLGGMAHWGGVVRAIREGLAKKYKGAAGTLLVDAGDQFQGTLLSNFDEGQLVFAAMDKLRYDMVIPGNHDYDFGPIDWLVDQPKTARERREALERIVGQVSFPFISANTYLAEELVDTDGRPIDVAQADCKPQKAGVKVDWERAPRPRFLKPYTISEVAGVRVALIGLDHPRTHQMTTAANVVDLCFDNGYEAYVRVRAEIKKKNLADVFVLVIHDGDANSDHEMSKLTKRLTENGAGKALATPLVDAVVSGHTHFSYNLNINGIAMTQSGSDGARFGRIDLIWDKATRKVVHAKTRSAGGVRLFHEECAPEASEFCDTARNGRGVRYEGVAVTDDVAVRQLIAKARKEISALAEQPMGVAEAEVTKDRILESPLADQMTDHIRLLAGVDIALINTGGIRNVLPKGKITYEDLFRVFPFNNHAQVIGPMKATALKNLLEYTVKTCGIFGSLMQSGLRVTYQRDCTHSKENGGKDPSARLLHVETIKGEVIYDRESGVEPSEKRTFEVVTFDFLRNGGDGFSDLKHPSIELKADHGILREWLKDRYLKTPGRWNGNIDGRWKDID